MKIELRRWAVGLAVLALCLPLALGSDDLEDLPDDELTEEVTAAPIHWEPYITHLYVKTREKSAAPSPLHFEAKEGVLPSPQAAWDDLKPHVRFRGDAHWGLSYLDEELVINGWRLNKDASGFEVHAGFVAPPRKEEKEEKPAKGPVPREKRRILAALADQELTIFVGVDVLMSEEDPKERDEILRKFFRLDRFQVSIHLIDPKYEKFRSPPPKEPITNGRTGQRLDHTKDWMDARDWVGDFRWTRRLRVGGAYAIRVKAAVSGRVDQYEMFQAPKEVEGEIRFALVDQAIKVTQLQFEETGKTDLFDRPGEK